MRKLALTLVAASLLVGACAQGGNADGPGGEPVEDPVITISGMSFQDGSVVVEAGTTVTWVWEDGSMEHDVVSDDGLFESPLQAEGEWSHTFDQPGTYGYHCTPHPFMTGVIEVVEAGA